MSPTTKELLEASKQHNNTLSLNAEQLKKAIAGALTTSVDPAIPGVHPSQLALTDPDEDPFNGNLNNRRVAERIAAQGNRVYTNASRPLHTGDPNKAAADIAKSKRINPDVIVESEEEPVPVKLPPTPGSPAAIKAAEEAAKKAKAPVVAANAGPGGARPVAATPPTWKPNA